MNKKNNLSNFTYLLAGLLIGISYTAYAFQEPVSAPPLNNVNAPINTSITPQEKKGDLTVKNFTAEESVTLGGVRRTAWPKDNGTCDWSGTRCQCSYDGGGTEASIIIGLTCDSGKLTDFKIVNFVVTSGSTKCPSEAPAGCTPSLWNK